MSAIFGLCFLDGRPVEEMWLNAMAGRLAHRGPDGVGIWRQGTAGLGHCMLRTTPQSFAERLPLVEDGGNLVLTADARIDNRKELISVLGLNCQDEEKIPDANLILTAYKRWGEEAPEHLVGDFAFAVWDARRRTVFCARDPMGIRPFYYYHGPDRLFAFASEIKGVLACPEVPRRLNEVRVANHLLENFKDAEGTFYQDVFRLPAAHCVTVGPRSMRMRRYWSLDCTRELRLSSDQEYAEAFREVFVEAVRCRTRSAFPVGSTLSGGLDSSSIACTANLVLPDSQRPLRTFSAIFPNLPEQDLRKIDERSYVQAVLETSPFDQSYVNGDLISPLTEWQRVFWHLDEACLAPNLFLHWGLYKAAAAKGVRVFLDGLDGDTTVSHGLGYLTDLVRTGHWMRFWSETRALSRRNESSYPLRAVVWNVGIRPLIPQAVIRSWRAVRSHGAPDGGPHGVISRAFAERIGRGEETQSHRRDGSGVFTNARQDHGQALNSSLIPYAMEIADKASGAFAVEARYPFFDRRLIEFCLAIPAEQKLHQGWTRSVMRRAMTGILPAAVQWRVDKADLSPNFKRGLFERDRATIDEVVFSRKEYIREYVDEQALHAVYTRWLAHPMRGQRDALTLYGVATLALWLETFKLDSSAESAPRGDRSLHRTRHLPSQPAVI